MPRSTVGRGSGRPARRIPYQELKVPIKPKGYERAIVEIPLKNGSIDFQGQIEARVSRWLQAEEDMAVLEQMAQGYRLFLDYNDETGQLEWVHEILSATQQLAAIQERAKQAQKFLEMALDAGGRGRGGGRGGGFAPAGDDDALTGLHERLENGEG